MCHKVENTTVKSELPVKTEKAKTEKAKTEEALPGKAVYTTDLLLLQCTQHFAHTPKAETSTLGAGPDQLLVAHFSNGTYVTELSNLLLASAVSASKGGKKKQAKKKPAAAAKVQKKPAAAAAPAVAAARAPGADARIVVPGPLAPKSSQYQVLWYKNTHTVGIRERFAGKKQIFSFGGTRCDKSHFQLDTIGKNIVADLDTGMAPMAAKVKARDLASA